MQVAQRLHKSIAWVKLHSDELGGVLRNGRYMFPQTVSIEQITTTRVHVGNFDQRIVLDGELAAQVFDLLERGRTTREIVQLLKITPDKVRYLTNEWIALGRFDNTELAMIHGTREPPQPAPLPPPPPDPYAEPAPMTIDDSVMRERAQRSSMVQQMINAAHREVELASTIPDPEKDDDE